MLQFHKKFEFKKKKNWTFFNFTSYGARVRGSVKSREFESIETSPGF